MQAVPHFFKVPRYFVYLPHYPEGIDNCGFIILEMMGAGVETQHAASLRIKLMAGRQITLDIPPFEQYVISSET